MCALGEQRHQHHQIRKRKQPLIGAQAGGFRGARDETEVAALRKIVHVLDANPRQAGNFRIGENLLARLYGDHGPAPLNRRVHLYPYFDAVRIVGAACFLSNSRSVLPAKNERPSTFAQKAY